MTARPRNEWLFRQALDRYVEVRDLLTKAEADPTATAESRRAFQEQCRALFVPVYQYLREEWLPRARRFCSGRGQPDFHAENLLQEAFTACFDRSRDPRRLSAFPEAARCRAYRNRILRNISIRYWERWQKGAPPIAPEQVGRIEQVAGLTLLPDLLRADALAALLRILPLYMGPLQRIAFCLELPVLPHLIWLDELAASRGEDSASLRARFESLEPLDRASRAEKVAALYPGEEERGAAQRYAGLCRDMRATLRRETPALRARLQL